MRPRTVARPGPAGLSIPLTLQPCIIQSEILCMLSTLHRTFFQGADAVQPCPVFIVMAVLPEHAGFAACCSIPME